MSALSAWPSPSAAPAPPHRLERGLDQRGPPRFQGLLSFIQTVTLAMGLSSCLSWLSARPVLPQRVTTARGGRGRAPAQRRRPKGGARESPPGGPPRRAATPDSCVCALGPGDHRAGRSCGFQFSRTSRSEPRGRQTGHPQGLLGFPSVPQSFLEVAELVGAASGRQPDGAALSTELPLLGTEPPPPPPPPWALPRSLSAEL